MVLAGRLCAAEVVASKNGKDSAAVDGDESPVSLGIGRGKGEEGILGATKNRVHLDMVVCHRDGGLLDGWETQFKRSGSRVGPHRLSNLVRLCHGFYLAVCLH